MKHALGLYLLMMLCSGTAAASGMCTGHFMQDNGRYYLGEKTTEGICIVNNYDQVTGACTVGQECIIVGEFNKCKGRDNCVETTRIEIIRFPGMPYEIELATPVAKSQRSKRFGPAHARIKLMTGPGNPADGDARGCYGAGAGGIEYVNGKYQNGGYAYVPAMENSRIGDRVRLCLVSVPMNCPPGDDRGKTYTDLNLRTHGRWRKPNASHGCGGA